MKPYVCGGEEVYVPDTNCNCNSAEGISVRSPIFDPDSGYEIEVSNLQDNLDGLLSWLAELYQYCSTIDTNAPWFEATLGSVASITAKTQTKVNFRYLQQSEGAPWAVNNGSLDHTGEEATYEVSAQVAFTNSTTSATGVIVELYDSSNNLLAVTTAALPANAQNFSGRATAVISPFNYTAPEGETLSLYVVSGQNAQVNNEDTHIFIRKIARKQDK